MIFLDTPGLHKPQHRLGEYMVDQAQEALPEADVIRLVVDVTEPPGRGDELMRDIQRMAANVPVVLAINKVDLVPPDRILAVWLPTRSSSRSAPMGRYYGFGRRRQYKRACSASRPAAGRPAHYLVG